mgnify:CR=1 FL=1
MNAIYESDDYAIMENSQGSFYFGYEWVFQNDKIKKYEEIDNENDYEWAFVFQDHEGHIIEAYSTSYLEKVNQKVENDMPIKYLLVGINQLRNDHIL